MEVIIVLKTVLEVVELSSCPLLTTGLLEEPAEVLVEVCWGGCWRVGKKDEGEEGDSMAGG